MCCIARGESFGMRDVLHEESGVDISKHPGCSFLFSFVMYSRTFPTMESRYAVWNDFQTYQMNRDPRSMDVLCRSSTGDTSLQKHQQFLRDYAHRVPTWKSLLLYHGLGTGKTITSIVMAETFLRQHPRSIVRVILPARLRTNFMDELTSSIGLEHLLSKQDWALYHASSTPRSIKQRIKRAYQAHIDQKYDIMSYERFALRAMKEGARTTGGLRRWCESFTRNAMLVVDEAHNLMSGGFEPAILEQMRMEDRLIKIPGLQTALMMLVAEYAHASSKLLCLTGTPIFDNLRQLELLVQVIRPGSVPTRPRPTVKDWVELLRGRVSYFPGSSPNAYPSTTSVTHTVPASEIQSNQINGFSDDAFMSNSRQICLTANTGDRFSAAVAVRSLHLYAPKILRFLREVDRPGKHVVYSSFIERGLDVVQKALEQRGWISYDRVRTNPSLAERYKNRVFVVWSGSTLDVEKRRYKSAFNHPSNIEGTVVRLVLGSPSIREGVTFKHVQHLHILDPVWNTSTMDQIQGRAVRFCSHVDIPTDHPFLERKVTIHFYKLVPGSVRLDYIPLADVVLYEKILVEKKRRIQRGERALKNVAMDRYLFGRLYDSRTRRTPVDTRPDASPFSFQGSASPVQQRRKNAQSGDTCPKRRRPDPNGRCPPGQVARLNRHGDKCCYKSSTRRMRATERRSSNGTGATHIAPIHQTSPIAGPSRPTPKRTCPKPRRPDTQGRCPNGYERRLNKHGEPCCYKVRGS